MAYVRGIFESEINAIHAIIRLEITLGYPSVVSIFDVISSLVSSPYMRRPTIPIPFSMRY